VTVFGDNTATYPDNTTLADGVLFSIGSYTLAADSTINDFNIYCLTGPLGGTNITMAIYTDSSGVAGSVVAYSDVVAIADGEAAGWKTNSTVHGTNPITAGTYHLVVYCYFGPGNPLPIMIHDDPNGNKHFAYYISGSGGSTPPPSPFVEGGSSNLVNMSFYLNVTAVPTVPPGLPFTTTPKVIYMRKREGKVRL